MFARSLLFAAVVTAPAFGQAAPASSPLADVRAVWMQTRDYLVESAKDVPEAMYAYKPTPEVRSFGELIGHIAGSQAMFCAIALGEKPPAEDAVEKTAKTKAALMAALDASNKVCLRAYQQPEKPLSGVVDLFGEKRSRYFTLVENATHDNEHYGNIVTYMRMNKMVPPSSKPR